MYMDEIEKTIPSTTFLSIYFPLKKRKKGLPAYTRGTGKNFFFNFFSGINHPFLHCTHLRKYLHSCLLCNSTVSLEKTQIVIKGEHKKKTTERLNDYRTAMLYPSLENS